MRNFKSGHKLSAYRLLAARFAAIVPFRFSIAVLAQSTVAPTSVVFGNVVLSHSSRAKTVALTKHPSRYTEHPLVRRLGPFLYARSLDELCKPWHAGRWLELHNRGEADARLSDLAPAGVCH